MSRPRRRHLVALLALALGAPAAFATPAPTHDLCEWARPATTRLADAGLWAPPPDALPRDATRRELARLVADLGSQPVGLRPAPALADVAAEDPDAPALGLAVARGLLTAPGGRVRPDDRVTGREADRAFVRALPLEPELRGLASLPFHLPAAFPSAVLARELGLRRNVPFWADALERGPDRPQRVADLVGMASRLLDLLDRPELLDAVAPFARVRLRVTDPARRRVIQRALWEVGQPYVWGGEWPTPRSPVDPQATGGFDCSGPAWFALGARAGALEAQGADPLRRRTADAMAWERSWRRVARGYLRPGDLVFFGPRGLRRRGSISHVAVYLGAGLIVQSSGSRAGVSVSRLDGYWPAGLAWGRRPSPPL
jgi:hypothetical protein